ncbi:MAG: hypothetical protein LAO76_26990 [Acidobacteriia bacterium]|nr:hypothetical protein [Terriglobia bacterium]
MEQLNTGTNGSITPPYANEAGVGKTGKPWVAVHRYRLLAFSGLAIFLAALFALGMPIWSSPLEIEIETPNDRDQANNISFKTPEENLRGSVRNARGFFGRNMILESEVYPCINGWCEPRLIGQVDANGIWMIPHVLLRYPAKNTGQAKLQVILVKNRHSHAPLQYFYSNTLNATFPKPEITLESICDHRITASMPRRIGCKSLKLEGKARSLLWMRERICVQIISKGNKAFCLPAALRNSATDENSWTLYYKSPVSGNLEVNIGLDATTTGKACNPQSVLLSEHFLLAAQAHPPKGSAHGNL